MNTNVFSEPEGAREIRERDGMALRYIDRAERPGLFERLVTFLLRFGLILLLTAIVVRVAV